MLCTRCGTYLENFDPRDDRVTADLCEPCSDNFFASMAQEFPFGQCSTCGVAYRQAMCEQGKAHTFANHVEGACNQWSDGPEGPDETAVSLGVCSYGCRAAPETWGAYFAAVEAARFVVYRFVEQRPPTIAAALAGTLDRRDSDADYDLPF